MPLQVVLVIDEVQPKPPRVAHHPLKVVKEGPVEEMP